MPPKRPPSPTLAAIPTVPLPTWSEDPLAARARSIWGAADFLPIARSFEPGAREFISRLALRVGQSVLDVACGTGNLAIPAASAGARVTGVDIAPNLIAAARAEARAAGVPVQFDVGDVELLPYADQQFDATITMFGAMFGARPDRVAAELLRVTRSGGRIAMANWMPSGFVVDLLRAHTAIVPPPAELPSPLLWGDEATVRLRFGNAVTAFTCVPRSIHLRFEIPPAAVSELFATCYGPTVATLKAAETVSRQALRDSLTRLFEKHNIAGAGATEVVGEYLEVYARVA
ncbi:MAG: methyltransferase domain-containing protein [Gemmatimonadota bacterium]